MSHRTTKQAAEAATSLRVESGIGGLAPVPDIRDVAEDVIGVPVFVAPLGEGIAGALARVEGNSMIFVNSDDAPTRRRFTLAHELGHHVFGDAGHVDRNADLSSSRTIERNANAFAAEFLIPAAGVDAFLRSRDLDPVQLDSIVKLAHWYSVSTLAAYYRLCTLRHISRKPDKSRLELALAMGEDKSVAQALALEPKSDRLGDVAIGATKYPKNMGEFVAEAYRYRLAPDDHLARSVGLSPTALRKAMAIRCVERADEQE